jgi:hypothetical protein
VRWEDTRQAGVFQVFSATQQLWQP